MIVEELVTEVVDGVYCKRLQSLASSGRQASKRLIRAEDLTAIGGSGAGQYSVGGTVAIEWCNGT